MKKALPYIALGVILTFFVLSWRSLEGFIVAFSLAVGYALCMIFSIRSAKKLKKYEEIIIEDATYDTSGIKFLPHALIMNLPYYFIYFVVSLIPAEFYYMWFIAGLPCAFLLTVFPLSMTCQLYSFLTGKKARYWLVQVALAVVIWLVGRAIVIFAILPNAT